MQEKTEGTYDKYIKALTEISRAITSDRYLEDILRLIVMVTAKVTGVQICSLWLAEEDERGKRMRLKATQAIDPDYVKDRVLKMDEGIVGLVATKKSPVIIEEVLKEPKFKEKEMAKKLGLVSMASVPMFIKKDKVIGVLNCFTSSPHIFSEIELDLITAVANQAAVAIFNTELMVKTRVIQEELESRKLIDRAKEILMKKSAISADQAYRWIQKKSMDTRKSMKEIAEAVLISQDV